MSDFHVVDPRDWEYDLQSVYSAYMGYFQLHNIPWHDRPWGQFFETFEQFLAFSWPVVTVTDTRTGRAHIVTRMTSINAFLKMIKIRFGEVLPRVDNMFVVTPIETSHRHLRHINDWSTYKQLHSSLPIVALVALKARVRAGDPSAIRELWATRDKTFLAVDFEILDGSCAEWGYAAIRSSHLEAVGAWPPVPHTNYRKGHYVVAEYTDRSNKSSPSLSSQYAFGESQVIAKAKLPYIIQSTLSGLVSPESETVANNVVLVGHGIQTIIQCLEQMKIKLPNNMLIIDIAYFERALFNSGERGPMANRKTGKTRTPEALLSLSGLLHSFSIEPPCVLHNAGNDAFMVLVTFQGMMDLCAMASAPAAAWIGMGNGIGKGEMPRESGSLKRAARIASRFFRPREGTHLPEDRSKTASLPQRRIVGVGGDEVDEMGVDVGKKRVSMFNAFTPPLSVPTKKSLKKTASHTGSTSSGRWLSSSPMALPAQRRQSVMV